MEQREDFKHDAFISYSRIDAPTVKQIHYFLRSYYIIGLPWPRRIYTDTSRISGNRPFPESIRHALDTTRYLVICCSEAAKDSAWVNAEIEYYLAIHESPKIILCLIGRENTDESNLIPERVARLERESEALIHSSKYQRFDFRGENNRFSSYGRGQGINMIFGILGMEGEDIAQRLLPNILFLTIPLYLVLFLLLYLLIKSFL